MAESIRLRRWCVAWDGSPFGIRIDSRHFTRRGARSRLIGRQSMRYFVARVDDACRLDDAVYAATTAGALPTTRFDPAVTSSTANVAPASNQQRDLRPLALDDLEVRE